ncbi:DEAD/DEAH box helicase [Mycoplasmatota bacterium]|nr:DEAD/DEAH box helicase [Mycoplasmatota bacterium]
MIETKFKNFIKEAIKELGFKKLTEIQEKVIPNAILGKSIVGRSQTGSGKTHAFLFPIFENLELNGDVEAVICSPTRELAEQIYLVANQIAKHSKERIDIRLYTGGTDRLRELKQLSSQPTIAIGTPGKLHDFVVKEQKLLVHTTSVFVIDEADMALEDGFLEELDQVAGMMKSELQMMVFSATIPSGLEPFLKKYLDNPLFISIEGEKLAHTNIEHFLIATKYKGKDGLLCNLLDILNPYLSIIFTNTKKKTIELAAYLRSKGYTVGEIHGDLPVRIRKQMMRRTKNLQFQYIVATDIAARGIDIDDVSHVINYELPTDVEFYIHRTGRTARANNKGIAISFYDYESYEYLDKLEEKNIKFTFKEIKNGELVDSKIRNQRTKKVFVSSQHEQANAMIKKTKKVKPGYKKKRAKEVEKLAKRLAKSSKRRRK